VPGPTYLRAGLAIALAVAALVISGCKWGSYRTEANGNLFVVRQDVSDTLIFACTANFGTSGRAKCALDLIWAACLEQGDQGTDGWPYCYDATRYPKHRADMETAIQQVIGKYECLSYVKGYFTRPTGFKRSTAADDPIVPGVYKAFWQGADSGTFGCPWE
jgi:hypothetical protein